MTSSPLVLSLFPGGGLLDHAFALEGFTVVRGPDVIFGGDVREFHAPAARFEGVIGGDPCQAHSILANLVRAKGLEPEFPDMTPEYRRVVEEARPVWFLRENVVRAPEMEPDAYSVRSFVLDNSTLDSGDGTGNEQMRRRKWWFGVDHDPYRSKWSPCPAGCGEFWCRLHDLHASACRCLAVDAPCPELRSRMEFALFELPDADGSGTIATYPTPGQRDRDRRRSQAVAGDARRVFIPGGQAEVDALRTGDSIDRAALLRKATAVGGKDGAIRSGQLTRTAAQMDEPTRPPVAQRDLGEMLRLQGFAPDWFDRAPWTVQAKRKIVGNGVPLPMGRALARAIKLSTDGSNGRTDAGETSAATQGETEHGT